MNLYGWPESATWHESLELLKRMGDPLVPEAEKFHDTAFYNNDDTKKYWVAVIWPPYIVFSIVWLLSWLGTLLHAWPNRYAHTCCKALRIAEYVVQFVFGAYGCIILFAWRPSTGEFAAKMAKNLNALSWMTIYLLFVLNGILAAIYGLERTRYEATRHAIHVNYIWIGLLQILTIGGGGLRNETLQVFAGVTMIVGAAYGAAGKGLSSEVPPVPACGAYSLCAQVESNKQIVRSWRDDVWCEWVMYTCFSISAVLMLNINIPFPAAWWLQNATLAHPYFCVLIFLWTLIGVVFLVHVFIASSECARGCMGTTSSGRKSSKRSSASSICGCC